MLEIDCSTGKNLLFIKENFKLSELISTEISEETIRKANSSGIRGIKADVNKDKIPI
ncbi:hypothetical protein [Metallosphaera tengchongensis]|uniref:hypothetical protein n=1 Tax=Metallosphaera tengchongensis TaxID=1532350 RepID=UPI001FE914C0|nr:hypothetical protein [Metallosphaera tengchongensis]